MHKSKFAFNLKLITSLLFLAKKKKIFVLLVIIFLCICKKSFSFEAFPQPKGMLFLNPYTNFSWHNNPLGGGKYDTNDKVKEMYFGLFSEYGLTKNITIGTDTFLTASWNSANGKIGGTPMDKAFGLQQAMFFARYTVINRPKFAMSVYTAVITPSLMKGTGKLNMALDPTQWKHVFRLELGYRFDNGDSITFNVGYQAQYNYFRDIMDIKISYFHKFPYDFVFYGYIRKAAYINKTGNSTYGFVQDKTFNIDAFDMITKNGYVALDLFIGKKVGKGKFIVLAYTRSFASKIFFNKDMKYGFNSFWLEFWWFLDTNKTPFNA